jgi:hypothetical protein
VPQWNVVGEAKLCYILNMWRPTASSVEKIHEETPAVMYDFLSSPDIKAIVGTIYSLKLVDGVTIDERRLYKIGMRLPQKSPFTILY